MDIVDTILTFVIYIAAGVFLYEIIALSNIDDSIKIFDEFNDEDDRE